MRSQGFLQFEPQYPYGPSLVGGAKGKLLKSTYVRATQNYQTEMRFVAQKLGPRPVSELERVATAFYIMSREPGRKDVAHRLTDLKPHIELSDAKAAVAEADALVHEFKAQSRERRADRKRA